MVMTPQRGPVTRRPLRGLLCRFRGHREASARLTEARWSVHLHFCRRCRRLFDAHAKKD